MIDAFADLRDMACEQRGEAAQRVDIAIDLGEPRVDQFGGVLELGARVDVPGAAVDRRHQHLRRVVMLVLDIADDLLDQVLERDEALGARIFVEHDRQMDVLLPHVGEQIERAARHRRVERLADEASERRRMLGAGREDREDVLDMDHADDRIEIVAIDRQAAVAGLGEQLDEVGERRLLLDRDDVGARHADIACVPLAEMQQVADHLALERGEIALGIGGGIALVPVDRILELIAQRFVGGTEDQAFQPAPDTVGTIAVSGIGAIGHRGRQSSVMR